MDKNIEVELRARIENLTDFENSLKEKGATFVKSAYLRDIYFCKKDAQELSEVEMNAVGSYSVRLRISKKESTEQITLNTKTILTEGDHNAWEEHEVSVGNFSEAGKILTLTEFKPFFELEKTRRVYKLDQMEISVEDITGFGGAVEIEIMAVAGEEESSKDTIRKFLHSVGIENDMIVPKSITNIIMKERAFNQEIIL